MNELTKWAWIIFIVFLAFGGWAFVILGAELVVVLLLAWLKPEWLDKM